MGRTQTLNTFGHLFCTFCFDWVTGLVVCIPFKVLDDLKSAFGDIPALPQEQQPLDYILNQLRRSEFGLTVSKWQTVWPALIRVLCEIDYLSHPNEDFDIDEPAPEDAMDIPISSPTQSPHLN
ncbi:hypothetical protein INT45_006335 [Circinella minor]|uniref:Uncharacterized protein n=1 Tax=Circinella minor TaxID=1195481 RepID=A0A8H7V9X1_9FUNG|nr:hypothetical protein INT45_006335 [Circinella minor]